MTNTNIKTNQRLPLHRYFTSALTILLLIGFWACTPNLLALTLSVRFYPNSMNAGAWGNVVINLGGTSSSATANLVVAGTVPVSAIGGDLKSAYNAGSRSITLNFGDNVFSIGTFESAGVFGSKTVTVTANIGAVVGRDTLTVIYPDQIPIGSSPSVTTQPQSQTVGAGESVTLSVIASGTATLTYQWRKDGIAITGANSSNYTINNVQPSDAGAYSVVVSNIAGSVTSVAAELAVNSQPASRPTYTIVDIGNNTASGANAVNNEGAVVGDSVVASGGYHAFLYTNGFLFDIGTLSQISCHSAAINDAGEITGFVGNSLLGDEGSIMRAFLYKGGLMTDLAALIPNHQKSWGLDINNAGQVVGWYVSSAGQRPFLYSNGTIQDLGFDGGASSINDSDQIVGTERVGGEYRVVVISGGIKQVLSNLGNASAGHINNSGQIVGNFTATSGKVHAFLYSTGQVIDLGTLGGNTSQAFNLNNQGQVVGAASTTDGTDHAYVYRQGTMLDLNSLIPNNSGWVLTQAYGINDSGLIVGVGKKSGVGRAFLLVPTGTNPPVTNQVLSLDGSSGYATVPDSSPLRLSSGDFSVTAWVWLSSYDTFGTAIMVKRESGSGRGWMFSVAGAAQLGGQALRPAFGVSENSDPRVFGTTVITTNEWHHVAVTYNAAKSFAELYMDGVLSGTNNLPQPMSTSSPLYIGRDSKVPQYFLNGRLDEVSIWNRALTQGEILSMKSCPLPRSDANLVAYWNFDDGTASDVTGHGHNGTFAGNAQAVLIQGTDAVHAGCGSEPLGRVAIGNATVMNGFIIDATITDGGFGYTNTPTVRIFEGGGSGAQAVAVVSNGVVTAIHILDAGSGYTNQPVMVIAPPFIEQPLMGVTAMSLLSFSNLADGTTYQLQAVNGGIWSNIGTAFTASNSTFTRYVPGTAGAEDYWLASLPVSAQAIATVQVVNGFVVGATVTSGGSGYVTNPAVTISGGGGANAAAMAHVSGGVVTAITITSAGIGYTDTPTIIIAPPPVNALWPTMAQVMKLDLRRLAPYDNYQLEFCPLRGGSWSNYTAPFIPTSATDTLYINVTGNAGFMRTKHLP